MVNFGCLKLLEPIPFSRLPQECPSIKAYGQFPPKIAKNSQKNLKKSGQKP
jgi:hypothetical protein